MDFLGAVYRAVRKTVKSSFSFKENHLSISSRPVINDFYCRHGNRSLTHQLRLNHTTRFRHPGGQTIYERNWIEEAHACSTHLILSSPQVTRLHFTWRNYYWQSIYRSVRLFNHHTTISWRPLRKTGLRWIPAGHGCACCLLSSPSPLCLHQFFHIRKWVKAIASRSARVLFGISNIY